MYHFVMLSTPSIGRVDRVIIFCKPQAQQLYGKQPLAIACAIRNHDIHTISADRFERRAAACSSACVVCSWAL